MRNGASFFRGGKQQSFFVRDGLIAHFNLDNPANYTAESNRIGYWRDSVTGYYVTQSSAGNKPTIISRDLNARAGIAFLSGRNLYSSGTIASNNLATLIDENAPHTVFIVNKRSNSATNMCMFSIGVSGSSTNNVEYGSFTYIGSGSAADVVRTSGGTNIEGNYLDNLSGSVYSYRYNGTSFTTAINGISSMIDRTVANKNVVCDSFFIGQSFYSGSFFFSYIGNLYEILIYNRALTDQENYKMNLYLKEKYGIQNL